MTPPAPAAKLSAAHLGHQGGLIKRVALVTLVVLIGIVGGSIVAKNDPDEHDSLLHKALRERNYDAAQKIMPTVEDIDALGKDQFGDRVTALAIAAQDPLAEGYDVARALVEKYGAELEARASLTHTPWHNAAMTGHLAIVELLLRNGAEVDALVRGQERKITPLHIAIQFMNHRVAET